MATSLEKIKEFAGAETIIGEAIPLPNGNTILPVSKVSMGFASGGMDYSKRPDFPGRPKGFGGGGGTGVSITPIAFLVAEPSGKVNLLPVISPKNIGTVDKIASLIERVPDIIGDIRDVISDPDKRDFPTS